MAATPLSSVLLYRFRLLPRASISSPARPFLCRWVFLSSDNGELSNCGGVRASQFVANFGAKVEAIEPPFATVSLDRMYAGRAHLKSQIHSSRQRVAKKISIRPNQGSRHGISPKAAELIEKVLRLPDVKEEVFKELDRWVISEGKFPIAYLKQAIQVFEREQNWSRIIQISEWLVPKKEGKTLRTFEALLKALDMQHRIDEAEAIWKNYILHKSWSIPTRLVEYVLAMFERHHKPIEIIKLFTMMEDDGRNLDKKSIKRVARAYEEEGFLEMKKQILVKYRLAIQD